MPAETNAPGGSRSFDGYDTGGFYDEMFQPGGIPRPGSRHVIELMASLLEGDLIRRQRSAETALLQLGISFNVQGAEEGRERIIPFDLIPRIIEASEWKTIEEGLKQRIQALNLFLDDIYHDQKVLQDKVIPEEVITGARSYLPQCAGLDPPGGIWCHISGCDLVRDQDGGFYVLEDNLRCPSGVSYVLENRRVLKHAFPQAFEACAVRPVDDYPNRLLEMLHYVAPQTSSSPTVVVLTPGVYNSAYFEHSFLAQQMGIELVEGRDLVADDGYVYVRTTQGLRRVDVIYRRIDDLFLDPQVFRPDSMLGVPGLMDAYQRGHLALANAPGTGIADDKVVYAYVPEMVRYYLDQEPQLPNVPTYLCWRDADRRYVLAHLEELVVKTANESGGYGMLVGPHSTTKQRDEFALRIEADPRNYIAQPTLALSRAPIIAGDEVQGRHVDLRPFVLYGEDIHVLPGGLTRVALRKGSLVVNSSQGGGSKDTWVLSE
jgi:uncharacterized circularly permuted ATP-grasp superfamily protein